MTRDETKRIVRIVCTTYPNWRPENMTDVVDVWDMFFSSLDYDHVSRAVKRYIETNTSGFAPAISQILELVRQNSQKDELSEGEAWALVTRAISRSAYYSIEEYGKLPKDIQKAVGSASQLYAWAIDENPNLSVTQSNFLKSYRSVKEQSRQEAVMTPDLRDSIAQIREKEKPLAIDWSAV